MEQAQAKRFILLDKPAPEAWDLMTQPQHLEKWFCDQAQVENRPGGKFEFSGKCVVNGGDRTQWSRYEKNEALGFDWNLFGIKTQVGVSLDRQADMSRLIVHHQAISNAEVRFTNYCDHQGGPKIQQVNLDDIWWNNLGRLKYYVETGKEPFKPNLSIEPSDSVVQTMTVSAPKEKAWAALTEANGLDQWFGQNAKPSLKVGEKFDIGWSSGPQAVTECIAGEKIAYEWTYTNEPQTHVQWKVEAAGANAKITLVHSGFAGRPFVFNDYNRGWAGFMVRLALYLEAGIPARDWGGEVK